MNESPKVTRSRIRKEGNTQASEIRNVAFATKMNLSKLRATSAAKRVIKPTPVGAFLRTWATVKMMALRSPDLGLSRPIHRFGRTSEQFVLGPSATNR